MKNTALVPPQSTLLFWYIGSSMLTIASPFICIFGPYKVSHRATCGGSMCSMALALLHQNAHFIAMIRHSMNIIRNAVENINNGQGSVIISDQPLYTIAKQIQWKWPEIYSEEEFVIMLGGMHIENAALSTVGD